MEYTPIITARSKDIRGEALESLRGRWSEAVIAVLLYIVLVIAPMVIIDLLTGTNETTIIAGQDITVNSSPFSSLYSFLVTGPFSFGISMFFLGFVQRKNVDNKMLFEGFNHFLKCFGLMFMIGLFVILWSLLFVVPGIIAAFRYSQAFMIMADNPDKGIMQCIDESKQMMKGNKSKYFWLNLSFIGWILLAAIPVGIISGVASALIVNQVALTIVSYISSIGYLWLYTYMITTDVVFFRMLKGETKTQEEDDFDINRFL